MSLMFQMHLTFPQYNITRRITVYLQIYMGKRTIFSKNAGAFLGPTPLTFKE